MVGSLLGRLLEREREVEVVFLGARCWGRDSVVEVVGLPGTLLRLSGHALFHAWWLLWQFGHLAGTAIPLRCFSVQSTVGC